MLTAKTRQSISGFQNNSRSRQRIPAKYQFVLHLHKFKTEAIIFWGLCFDFNGHFVPPLDLKVYNQLRRGKILRPRVPMVKLILRDQEYEVRPGMTLLDALKKNNILSEGVLCTRDGELIAEDEILKEDDVIKVITAISGG